MLFRSLDDRVSEDDAVYELLVKEKTTLKNVLVDTFLEGIPSLVDSLQKGKYIFILVASHDNAKIYQIDKNENIEVIAVPSWSSDKKEKFTSITIGKHTYKKYKRLK